MMNKAYWTPAALLFLLALSLPAAASALPGYYPEAFDRWGVISRVDVDSRTLVVDDSKVTLSLNLEVHTPATRFGTIRSLQPGMKVGFGTTGSRAARRGAVAEVWVLPEDYSPQHPAH